MSLLKNIFAGIGIFATSIALYKSGRWVRDEFIKEFNATAPGQPQSTYVPPTPRPAPAEPTDTDAPLMTDDEFDQYVVAHFENLMTVAQELSEFSLQAIDTIESGDRMQVVMNEIRKYSTVEAKPYFALTKEGSTFLLCPLMDQIKAVLIRHQEGKIVAVYDVNGESMDYPPRRDVLLNLLSGLSVSYGLKSI